MGNYTIANLSVHVTLILEIVDVFHANVRCAHGTSCHAHVQNVIDTTVHVTHTPHTGLSQIGILSQPVVDVVDVEAAGSTSETLDERWNVELLQAGASAGEGLTTTRGSR